jgi:5'-nucleotidase
VGKLDLFVDDDTNSIVEHRWRLVRLDDSSVKPDQDLERYIRTYQKSVDDKYSAMISRLTYKHTHPLREEETSLGNLFADGLAEMSESDVMLLASGSIRSKELGPVVTLRDFAACFPYNEPLFRFTVTGAQMRRMFSSFMRKENRNGEGECYQVNGRVRACYDGALAKLTSLTMDGQEVKDDQNFQVCLQAYHAKNSKRYLDVSDEELRSIKAKVVATGTREVLEEWLRNNQNVGRVVEGRLQYL